MKAAIIYFIQTDNYYLLKMSSTKTAKSVSEYKFLN